MASTSANRYEIRVRGQVGGTIRAVFPCAAAPAGGADTTLTGMPPGQAAVSGVHAAAGPPGPELPGAGRVSPG